MTTDSLREILAADDVLSVGMPVRVRWGYGLGFRAEGTGTITKLYDKSVRVKLAAPVTGPSGGEGWPAGFELRGIPRARDLFRWNPEHCVVPA